MKAEKADKEKEIGSLRASNIKLIINTADRERKPASISSGVNRITILQTENEQLEGALQILDGQLDTLQNEFAVASLKQELQTNYYEKLGPYLKKAYEILSGLQALNDYGKVVTELIEELGKMRNPLQSGLYQIFMKCKSYEVFQALEFPWGEELKKFQLCTAIMAHEKELETLLQEVKIFSNIFYGSEFSLIPTLSSTIPKEPMGPVKVSNKAILGSFSGDNETEANRMQQRADLGL
ncbi:MAG: hypothetical protein GX654_05950 [Desulfatiglans sp.]|nr:hypothetical protein [Desulfatiglans sp.]